VAVVALGRLRGLLAVAGIVVTGLVLLGFVFPALLHGSSPLGVALTVSAIIAVATLYLAHGVSERTTVACWARWPACRSRPGSPSCSPGSPS
jgi:uncharacterized membrane protein